MTDSFDFKLTNTKFYFSKGKHYLDQEFNNELSNISHSQRCSALMHKCFANKPRNFCS